MWSNKRVFFCTPQTLVKDIEEGRCDARCIVCVVMDEAHRATGEHANSVLVRLIDGSGARYRLLGLSATPGSDIKSIQAVCTRLNISRIESRAEDDPDVAAYVHRREEEVIVVRQPDVVKSLDSKFSELILPILTRLREMRVSPRLQYDGATLQPWSVMQANKEYVERTGDYTLNWQFNALRELVHARTLLKAHGIQMARTKLAEATGKPFMKKISGRSEFSSLVRDLELASGGGTRQDGIGSDGCENNPKLYKLVEVLMEHFERKNVTGQSTRVIVFSQWRESVGEIVEMLISQNSSLLKPAQVSLCYGAMNNPHPPSPPSAIDRPSTYYRTLRIHSHIVLCISLLDKQAKKQLALVRKGRQTTAQARIWQA
jgi:Fanconi anemia group M protein